MTILIGENIKRLRRTKDITQEQLADILGITSAAVSKWERGDTYPDISLLPVLSRFFDVSLDELMGCDKQKAEEEINQSITQYHQFRANGHFDKATKLINEIRIKYPENYKTMIVYMHDLIGGRIASKETLIENERELTKMCNAILSGCSTEKLRLEAINIKAKLLYAAGDTNGALTLLSEFPNFGQTSGCMSEQLFEYETQESKDWVKRNLYGLADGFAIKLVKHYWFDETLSENKEQTIESIADKVKKTYEDSNCTLFLVMAQSLYSSLGQRMTAYWGNVENIIRIRKKQFDCAIAIDKLTESDEILREAIEKTYAGKRVVEWLVEHLKTTNAKTYEKLRHIPEYIQLIEENS